MKIFDLEGPEDPHVAIYRHASARWRANLRSGELMDREPSARGLPAGLLDAVRERLAELRVEWDRLHPETPIAWLEQDE